MGSGDIKSFNSPHFLSKLLNSAKIRKEATLTLQGMTKALAQDWMDAEVTSLVGERRTGEKWQEKDPVSSEEEGGHLDGRRGILFL